MEDVNHYQEFRNLGKPASNLGELVGRASPKNNYPGLKNASLEELKKLVYDQSEEVRSRFSKPEDIDDETARNYGNLIAAGARADFNSYFERNHGKIIEALPAGVLEKIVQEDVFRGFVSEEHRELISVYAALISARDFKRRYGKKQIKEGELEKISGYVSAGIEEEAHEQGELSRKKEIDRQKKASYEDRDLQGLAFQLTYETTRAETNRALSSNPKKAEEHQTRYVTKGIDREIRKLEEKYNSLIKSKEGELDERKIYKAAVDTFKKIMSSGNPELMSQAQSIIYAMGEN